MLYLKRPPRARSWELRRCVGALQIQRLEGSRPEGLWDLFLDEAIVVVCEVALLSVCFRFSCWWQREWSCVGMLESPERTTILDSEECETENQCARRSASEIRGWRCGFMRRTG